MYTETISFVAEGRRERSRLLYAERMNVYSKLEIQEGIIYRIHQQSH